MARFEVAENPSPSPKFHVMSSIDSPVRSMLVVPIPAYGKTLNPRLRVLPRSTLSPNAVVSHPSRE